MNQLILFDFANGAFAQHAIEILAMLLGSFAIGVWLGWAIWARYKFQVDQKDIDNQSNLATAGALREEIISVREKLAASDAECASLTEKNAILIRQNTMLDQERQSLEDKLSGLYATQRKLDTELALFKTPPPALSPESVPLELPDLSGTSSNISTEALISTPVDSAVFSKDTEELQEMPLPHLDIEPVPAKRVVFLENTDNDDTPVDKTLSNQQQSVFVAPADAAEPVPVTAPASEIHDDLTVIEGIGTKIQLLLNQYGIYTYQQLSETEVSRLSEILVKAGPQLAMHNPGTWPSQAKLAADGQWDTLTAIQGFLKGGKKPTL